MIVQRFNRSKVQRRQLRRNSFRASAVHPRWRCVLSATAPVERL